MPVPSASGSQQRLALLSGHLAAGPAAPHQPAANRLSSSSAPVEATKAAEQTATGSKRPQAPTADEFRFFLPFQSRWADNDQYSHLNNVVYSLYFDSITNYYLINHVRRPTPTSPAPLGLIVSSSTGYASSVAYPSPVIAALAVSHLGKSSVTWRLALFEGEYVAPQCSAPGSESGGGAAHVPSADFAGFSLQDLQNPAGGGVGRTVRLKAPGGDGQPARAAAYGEMVHVFVDPETRRPLPEGMGAELRAALEKLRPTM